MIKNKIKYLLITILGVVLIPTNVFATTATAYVSNFGSAREYRDIVYNNGKFYTDYTFGVSISGAGEGYCVDFGYHMNDLNHGGAQVSCELATNTAIAYVLNSDASHVVKQLALRLLSAEIGYSKSSYYVTTTDNYYYQEAKNLVDVAKGFRPTSGFMQFNKISEADNGNVTLGITSLSTKLTNVNFECENCSIVSSSWDDSGYRGNIVIAMNTPGCDYKIVAYYQPVGVDLETITNTIINTEINVDTTSSFLYCQGYGETQNTIFSINGNITGVSSSSSSNSSTDTTTQTRPITVVGDKVRQEYAGQLTNKKGTYYKKYCSSGNGDEHNLCEQETKIKSPKYCDKNNDGEKITIEAPTDVKNCILKNEDEAGNTYQMADGQISSNNPYCSVYCKENYSMSLPGAQYADSGRYFKLNNSVVNVTRTCYATSSENDNTKTNIDIEKFIKNVKDAQEKIVKAYNDYALAKAYYDSVKKSTNVDSSKPSFNTDGGSCTINGNVVDYNETNCKDNGGSWTKNTCQPTGSNNKNDGASVDYETISITTNSKGEATIQKHQNKTSANWGVYYDSCTSEKTYGGHKTIEGYEKDAKNAEATLTAAQNELKAIISHMEECYNWTNELCFDPIVEFDYKEEYKTKINYQKVSSSTTKGDVTYSSNKEITNEYEANESGTLETINYLKCDSNGCTNSETATNISTRYYYRKIVSTGEAQYANKQEFQTNIPHGTVADIPEGADVKYNYEYLGAVFPIALKTERGIYNWTLNFTKIGQYNSKVGCSSNSLGRLNDVAKAIGSSASTDIGYVCVYVVDCPDCDYECDCPEDLPDGYTCEKQGKFSCIIDYNEPVCPDCDVYCVNCIFDGKDTYFYRTVSLNDFNPNDRKLGSNWNNNKAKTTIENIEKDGEDAYITPEYTFTMTASNMKAIRDYNATTGTYISEDLSYEQVNGVTNIAGYSYFLRNKNNRTSVNKDFFKEGTLNNKWELWTSTSDNVGPAWK